jgi:hypothetical protein
MRHFLCTILAFTAFAHVAQAGDISPEVAQKELDSYVGKWEGTIELDGESSPARWTVEWAPGKQCIIFHEEYDLEDGTGKLTAIMGYDRINKQVVNLGFRTDGGNRTVIYPNNLAEGKSTGDGPKGEVWNSDVMIRKNDDVWNFYFKATSPEARDFSIRLRRKP